MTDERPHLSASQIDSYCRCGEAYRRRYLEGEKIPPAIAMIKGTGFHAAAEANMRQKIETHRDLPACEIIDVAVASFDAELPGGYILNEEETSQGVENVLGRARDDLADFALVHAREQAPDYQPTHVEQTVRIELPNAPRDLLAVIDLADDQGRVVDFKTAGKKKSQADADESVQLTIYAAGLHALTGSPPTEVRLDTVVAGKKAVTRSVVSSQRDEADFAALAHRINMVQRGIDAGVFAPATPGAWWCGPKWCGYWHSCPYVNSQRAALAEGGE